MSWPWIQVAVLMAMTHVVRAVGDRLGPRWGAIVLGMPSTTAVLLVGGGVERGADDAARAAEIALLGLVAAVALPLAYAMAVGRGRGVISALLSAVLGYVLTASVLRAAPDLGAVGGLVVALVGVVLGCVLASRLPVATEVVRGEGASRSMLLRCVVPALFLLGIRALRSSAGPEWAGLFSTFPAMSLAVLVTIHLEGGPGAVSRMARSMPRGNLGMVAFLIAYRTCCHDLSPFVSAAIGYGAVLVVMAGLVRVGREEPVTVPRVRLTLRLDGSGGVSPVPRGGRRFAPRVEAFTA